MLTHLAATPRIKVHNKVHVSVSILSRHWHVCCLLKALWPHLCTHTRRQYSMSQHVWMCLWGRLQGCVQGCVCCWSAEGPKQKSIRQYREMYQYINRAKGAPPWNPCVDMWIVGATNMLCTIACCVICYVHPIMTFPLVIAFLMCTVRCLFTLILARCCFVGKMWMQRSSMMLWSMPMSSHMRRESAQVASSGTFVAMQKLTTPNNSTWLDLWLYKFDLYQQLHWWE